MGEFCKKRLIFFQLQNNHGNHVILYLHKLNHASILDSPVYLSKMFISKMFSNLIRFTSEPEHFYNV